MRKFLIATAIAAVGSAAMAADTSQLSIGAGYGLGNGGVLSLHGDYDISDMANKKPVKVRVGYDSYSIATASYFGSYKWSYNVFYGGAYYDFGKELQMDRKIHPFAGLGFGFGSTSCSGTWCYAASTPTVGGLYFILGAQYDLAPNVAAEVNFNGWGGATLGVNFKF
ncbi:MAG: outer membrane beta-barrel protein [Rhodoferax sp.]|nr:outer membrane beta-barrel protein [Rhodoferax sp.]